MKIWGGLLTAGYIALHLLGYDPIPDSDRGRLPADARRGPGGLSSWHSGYMGGK